MKELLPEELLLRYVPGNVYARPYLAFVVEDREGSDAVAASEDHVIDLGAPDLAGRESPRMGADGLRLGPLFERIEHAVEGRRQVSYLVLGIDLNPLVDAGLAVGYPLYDLDVSPYGACDGPLYEDREQYPAY